MTIAQTLNHEEDPMDMSDVVLVAELCWAVIEVQLNDDTPGFFSEQVCAFVGRCLAEEGFITPIHPLDFAVMPYRYEGSDTAADENKAMTKQTAHAQVVLDYLNEQAALLLKHIAALPWHTPETIEQMTRDLQAAGR